MAQLNWKLVNRQRIFHCFWKEKSKDTVLLSQKYVETVQIPDPLVRIAPYSSKPFSMFLL